MAHSHPLSRSGCHFDTIDSQMSPLSSRLKPMLKGAPLWQCMARAFLPSQPVPNYSHRSFVCALGLLAWPCPQFHSQIPSSPYALRTAAEVHAFKSLWIHAPSPIFQWRRSSRSKACTRLHSWAQASTATERLHLSSVSMSSPQIALA